MLHITIKILQRGSPAPEIHIFSPFRTHSSPSSTQLIAIFVASEEATDGSVIAYAERISPLRSGVNHLVFCSSLQYRAKTSILPVSGAAQLNTSGAKNERPVSSAI